MDETNADWDDLRLFLAVARAGGLSGAASLTDKSAPTLGRRMLALERRLGRELFIREARGYRLTADGAAFLTDITAIEDRLKSHLAPAGAPPKPVVKISAGAWVSYVLCRAASKLSPRNEIRLRFIAVDQIVDIAHREAVIGIRNTRPEGLGLAGRKIGEVRFGIFSRDPDQETWAQVIGPTPSAAWVSKASKGANVIEVTTPRNALDLAMEGAAKVVLPTFIGNTTGLAQVGETIKELTHDQWLVTHHEDRFLPEVRPVIDRTYRILRDLLGQFDKG